MDAKCIENLFIICIICDYGSEKKVVPKKHQYEKTPFLFHLEHILDQNLFW
jgi:hypothetical protein